MPLVATTTESSPMEVEASTALEQATTSSTQAQTSPTATSSPASVAAASPPDSPHPPACVTSGSLTSGHPPCHNRSLAVQKNKIYFNLHITPSPLPSDKKVTATMKLEAYHQSFVKVVDALIHVDESLALWPFEEANASESELLKQPSALGSSINQITKYFDSFWISKTFSLAYVNCLISFYMDPDAFMQSAMSMLTDIPAKIYKHTLQVPHITSLGWIFGTHEHFALKDFEQLLQDAAAQLAPNQAPPVLYGLNFRPIWDSSSKAERDKDKSHNKWAIHIDAVAEIALTSKALLKSPGFDLDSLPYQSPATLSPNPHQENPQQ